MTTSSSIASANLQLHHKGNAYSYKFNGGNSAINDWSTVVMSTSSVMDSDKRQGRTKVQAWARLDTVQAHYGNRYAATVSAVETKMKATTANSREHFDIFSTNPGHRVSSYSVDTTIFDLLDYRVPGVGLIGNILNVFSNGLTSGTSQNLSNSKDATLTFLNPTNASLSNNISWRNANQEIGSRNKSGVTTEFNFRVLNGVRINVSAHARVQYGMYATNSVIPIKIWSDEASVSHTLN